MGRGGDGKAGGRGRGGKGGEERGGREGKTKGRGRERKVVPPFSNSWIRPCL